MSKNRPRATLASDSKLSPAYWRGRLFKNTYTYRGRLLPTRKWCVKIQHRGLRKTFPLWATAPEQAAEEARALYRRLLAEGWTRLKSETTLDALAHTPGSGMAEEHESEAGLSDPDYWAQRLVRRQYQMALRPRLPDELSVRIEHEGAGFYFPLGTAARRQAANRALRIHTLVAGGGWETAIRTFPRELTVAFHWLDRPLAWTYTTIHTLRASASRTRNATIPVRSGRRSVVIVEPDPGVRGALQWCLDHMATFACGGLFDSTAAALRHLREHPVNLVLVNAGMTAKSGAAGLRDFTSTVPGLVGVFFSVYEDSEELFRSTPGGATNYFLQRTASNQFLAPLESCFESDSPSTEAVNQSVWHYFRNALAAQPVGEPGHLPPRLTHREQAVLGLLGKGSRDKEIADRLGISIYTVHEHVRNIFEKLGVHNRTEAVVKFLQK